jgi:hypothetical protein
LRLGDEDWGCRGSESVAVIRWAAPLMRTESSRTAASGHRYGEGLFGAAVPASCDDAGALRQSRPENRMLKIGACFRQRRDGVAGCFPVVQARELREHTNHIQWALPAAAPQFRDGPTVRRRDPGGRGTAASRIRPLPAAPRYPFSLITPR